MALLKLWRSAMRAVAALLLLTFATPALAEIGCAGESVAHLRAGAVAGADDHATADTDNRSDPDKGSPKGHCAFNHGHCAGIPSSARDAAVPVMATVEYRSTPARPLMASPVDMPERPPSA
ncbi:hypothetical protein [Sphingosinicella sp. BN140058]|uniref:hypothetical protein n=1 Tax=Sphingosinicella sp. BN140058 TaxID=1892855 RepID=UPI001011077A|nr:hypothetical protein [Sphingosinicella sp. BN140058]QAY75316.1 hypothetical protein ETR14_01300 [Sphingosinicella sp. BN140058]